MKVYVYRYENNAYDEDMAVFSTLETAQKTMRDMLETLEFHDDEGRTIEECIADLSYSGDEEWINVVEKEVQ